MNIQTTIIPANEADRITALKRYEILDTPPDGSFNKITSLTAQLFGVPIAIISLVDTDRIWFKSAHGIEGVNQIDRVPGLCASAILPEEITVIENAIEDPRSLTNPLVAGSFGLRFYAAAPLQTHDGFNLGTICIIDRKQRYITEDQKRLLHDLGQIVMDEMELRLSARKDKQKTLDLFKNALEHLDKNVKHLEKLSAADASSEIMSLVASSKKIMSNIEAELVK
jgi:GAF domain-containing protein